MIIDKINQEEKIQVEIKGKINKKKQNKLFHIEIIQNFFLEISVVYQATTLQRQLGKIKKTLSTNPAFTKLNVVTVT